MVRHMPVLWFNCRSLGRTREASQPRVFRPQAAELATHVARKCHRYLALLGILSKYYAGCDDALRT